MAEALPIISPQIFSDEVLRIRSEDISVPLICRLGGGVLRFASAAFPGEDYANLYAHTYARQEGIGPHFDIYGDLLDEEFPWVGVYNVTGTARVRSTPLPEDLAALYWQMYPDQTTEAGKARRHFGAIALDNPEVEPLTFGLSPDIGMVLPQRRHGGSDVVHEVIGTRIGIGAITGKYLKIIRPNLASPSAMTDLAVEYEYEPFDSLVTQALSGGGKVFAADEFSEHVLLDRADSLREPASGKID